MKTGSVRLFNTVSGRLFPRLAAGFKQDPLRPKAVDYIQVRGEDGLIHSLDEQKKIEDVFEVRVVKSDKQKPPRGLLKTNKADKPLPCVASLGPITVRNPEAFTKKYKWCSCGMSKKQPFCDQSHRGTLFQPMRVFIQEPLLEAHFCGCKFSKEAPFCDGNTCKQLREQQNTPKGQPDAEI